MRKGDEGLAGGLVIFLGQHLGYTLDISRHPPHMGGALRGVVGNFMINLNFEAPTNHQHLTSN